MDKVQHTNYLERADYTWSEDSLRIINTPSMSVKQTFFYVQEVGYFRTQAPYFTERVNLNSFLIIYTLSGKGQLQYDHQTYEIEKDSLIYINCLHHHFYKCIPNQEWEFLWLHFNGPSALGYYEEFCKNGFHLLYDLDKNFVETILKKILLQTQKKKLYSEVTTSGDIVSLLTHLLTINSNELSPSVYVPSYLQQTISKIDKEFSNAIRLDDLSTEFGISKYHLAREFKRYLGVTIHEYLTLTRLTHAKELLKHSYMTVENIAYSCGFHQTSHFIHLFKSHEGMTPLQFRKDWGDSLQR